MAKRAKESLPAEDIVPAEEPADESVAVIPVKEPAPEPISIPPAEPPSGPGVGQRVRGFFNFLARLLLIAIILGLFGIGLYLVLPLLYQRYIQPVQENTTQLQQLQDQQEQSQQLVADLQDRLSALEAEQARQAESFTNMDQRLSEIETEIAARTESLETLEQMQATLQSQSEESSAELERQLNLLKGMELLSRARLFLYQSNFGLAQQDVQSARDLLRSVQADAPDSLADDLSSVILRLDLALSNLPDFPVAASDDLDIAWQILLGGTPPAQTLVGAETPTSQITSTPGAQPTGTPTPSVTLTPTATP
jgi:hypothetical protein